MLLSRPKVESPKLRDWQMPERAKKTQKTRPKKGKPIEIPVPKRGEVEGLLKRAAHTKPKK